MRPLHNLSDGDLDVRGVPWRARYRLIPTVTVLTAVLLAAAGCARTSPASAATDSGSVTVACGATEDWCAKMTTEFTKATGIKAGFVRLSSGELVSRLQAGRANPEFDVMVAGPADGFQAAADQNLLENYISPNAAAIPDRYKDPNGAWTGIYVGALGFCSNTKILAEKNVAVPKSWQDLLNPALKKQIGIAHPSTSGTAYTALWTQVTLHNGDQSAALDFMRQLHPNVLQYSKSGAAPGQQAARGEIAVGVIFSHDCKALQEQGFKDLTISFPSEGTGYETGGVGLVKGAHNPVSAKKFIDWTLTAPAQEIGPTVKAYQAPTNPNAKVSDKTVDFKQLTLVTYDVVASGKAKPDLTKRFDAEVAQAPKS
ncbi:ABC transporter substrate-binding protein [Dactylosporangium darangshiense]|uniref:ABC transporter substrate-binding protein n=1 Tax=Dactylosporangium darangshiense TaxID=579108 RepID=A0ABP8DSN3_9ACTN